MLLISVLVANRNVNESLVAVYYERSKEMSQNNAMWWAKYAKDFSIVVCVPQLVEPLPLPGLNLLWKRKIGGKKNQ